MLIKNLDYTIEIEMKISQEDLETLYEMAKIITEEFDPDSKEESEQWKRVFKELKELKESVNFFDRDSQVIQGRW